MNTVRKLIKGKILVFLFLFIAFGGLLSFYWFMWRPQVLQGCGQKIVLESFGKVFGEFLSDKPQPSQEEIDKMMEAEVRNCAKKKGVFIRKNYLEN